MKKFFVTMGVQWRPEDNPHPTLPKMRNTQWFRIEAEEEAQAREVAEALFDKKWAFLYPEEEFSPDIQDKYFPDGEYGSITNVRSA